MHYPYFLLHNLKSRFFNKRRPLLAGFKITYRCNLRCRSCPFWKIESPHISFDKATSVIDKLYDAGVRLLIFEGGEPLLWHDKEHQFEDLISHAKKRFFCTGITTNGMLPIESSADTIWVSLDGLKETHDSNRGKSFDRIMSNIKSSSHQRLLVNITISRLNFLDIPDLIKFLAPRVKGITIQFYYPFPNSENLYLPLPQRIDVLDKIIELKRLGYPVFNSVATLQALKRNTWHCHSWLIASAEPDGQISIGCYLKNRAEISCSKCGFAAHTEISMAYDWNWESIIVGRKTFGFRMV